MRLFSDAIILVDMCIYFIHRGLHDIKFLYAFVHKPHHKWIITSPFASHSFHPVDGFLQVYQMLCPTACTLLQLFLLFHVLNFGCTILTLYFVFSLTCRVVHTTSLPSCSPCTKFSICSCSSLFNCGLSLSMTKTSSCRRVSSTLLTAPNTIQYITPVSYQILCPSACTLLQLFLLFHVLNGSSGAQFLLYLLYLQTFHTIMASISPYGIECLGPIAFRTATGKKHISGSFNKLCIVVHWFAMHLNPFLVVIVVVVIVIIIVCKVATTSVLRAKGSSSRVTFIHSLLSTSRSFRCNHVHE